MTATIAVRRAIERMRSCSARALVSRAWMNIRVSRRTVAAFLIYAVLIAAVTPPIVAWYIRIAFYAFAVIVFWVVWGDRGVYQLQWQQRRRRVFVALAVFAAIFLVISRLLPFIRYGEAPLGYDTGFYLSSMDGSLNRILRGSGDRNFRALIWVPLEWLKIPPILYLHALYVLSQLLIAGAIYFLAHTLAPRRCIEYAAAAVFLFAVSIPQFFAYWWMFYQTELAIAFLLLTIALLYRRSWFALLTGLLGVLLHPATFLPFLIALVIHVAVQLLWSLMRLRPLDRDTGFLLLLAVLVTTVVQSRVGDARAFYLVYVYGIIGEYGWLYTKYPEYLQQGFTGLYVNRTVVHLADIYLLPFSVLGVLLFAFRRLRREDGVQFSRSSLLLIWMVVLAFLVAIPVVYQHRFLIYFDLVLILFAAYAFMRFLNTMQNDRVSVPVVLLLLVGFVLHGSLAVWDQRPQLYPDERTEIRAIATVAEESAYAMTTESVYTPWVSAFAGRPVIDPGFGSLNKWSYHLWREFWFGKSNARRHELLAMYDRPLYIFTGRLVTNGEYIRFIQTDPSFERVSPHVWRYDPRAITSEDIEAMRLLERADAGTPL